MGKKKKLYVFLNQLKTFENIENKIDKLILKYGELKGDIPGALFRIKVSPHTATLYKTDTLGKHKIIQGIKEADYKFSKSDPFMIEASNEHGLSFQVHLIKQNSH